MRRSLSIRDFFFSPQVAAPSFPNQAANNNGRLTPPNVSALCSKYEDYLGDGYVIYRRSSTATAVTPAVATTSVIVKAVTLDKLFEILQHPPENINSEALVHAFLLNYRRIVSATEAFDRLFNVLATPYFDLALGQWLCHLLDVWITMFWLDFESNARLYGRLDQLVQKLKALSPDLISDILATLSRKASSQQQNNGITEEYLSGMHSSKLDTSCLPSISNDTDRLQGAFLSWPAMHDYLSRHELKMAFHEIDVVAMAEQITLIESQLYAKITPVEFVGQAWLKNAAPNIARMTQWSNRIIRLMTSAVLLTKGDIKNRAASLEYLVNLGEQLRRMNNLNGVMEVMSSLESSALYRLRHTRSFINAHAQSRYDVLLQLVSSDHNYQAMRAVTSQLPRETCAIPFIGMYLTQLVSLDVTNADYCQFYESLRSPLVSKSASLNASPMLPPATNTSLLATNAEQFQPRAHHPSSSPAKLSVEQQHHMPDIQMINVNKWYKMDSYVSEILKYRESKHSFAPNADIQRMLQCDHIILDDEQAYQLSLEYEPRSPSSPRH